MYLLGIVELKDDSIDFTGKGISKAVSTSAKENKLLLIKYLPQLIENANEVASQPNVKDKREAKQYTYLMTHAIVGGKRENVIVTIFTDANGNKYYNHILNDEENKKRFPVYLAQAANKSDGIPAMREPFSTSLIPQKAEKRNKPDELRNQLSDGSKQAYDYALDKLSKGNEKVAQSAKESAFIYARMAERWFKIMHEYGSKTYFPEDYIKAHPIAMNQPAGKDRFGEPITNMTIKFRAYDIETAKELKTGSTSTNSDARSDHQQPIPILSSSNLSISDFLRNVNDNLGNPISILMALRIPNYGIYLEDTKTGGVGAYTNTM